MRQRQLPIGRVLGLLDERVQHDDALAQHEAVERAACAGPATRSKFEQSVAKGARVRETKTRSVLGHQFHEARVVGHDIDRPRLDFSEHALMEVLDRERHVGDVSKYANRVQ